MASPSSTKLRFKPKMCFCGRTTAIHITKSNENGNEGRLYCCCPSRYEKRPRQSCGYFQFLDEEVEDVTSMETTLYATQEELDATREELDATREGLAELKKRMKTLEILMKFVFVIALVCLVKGYMYF